MNFFSGMRGLRSFIEISDFPIVCDAESLHLIKNIVMCFFKKAKACNFF